MRIIDLETINQAMNNETQFVLRCEEVFHDKVSSAAAAVLSAGRERRIVALTGPSGSGKTTTAMRLRDYLDKAGLDRVPQAHTHQQEDEDIVAEVLVDLGYDGEQYTF